MELQDIHEVLALLERNEVASAQCFNMVPSENSMSWLAKIPLFLDVYHRYFFNDLEFRGAEDVAPLETELATSLLQEMTGATFINFRPLSGLNGMALILASLGGGPGSTVMTVAREQGGHYATTDLMAMLGLKPCYITGPDPHTIDFEQVAITLQRYRPHLLYVDQSNCLFPLDVEQLVHVTRSVAPDTLIHVDGSHWMGLILGGQAPNPLAVGADSFGGSTHKTFPGPQKAIFLTKRHDLAELVEKTQHHFISSHHFGATVSLAIALLEFKHCGGARYAANMVRNTQELGRHLYQSGLDVEGAERGFSAGHQLWVRTTPYGVSEATAGQRLYEVGIRVNVYHVPPISSKPFLRIGVNEATYLGLQTADMAELAAIMVAAIKGSESPSVLASQVAALRARCRMPYTFSMNDPKLFNAVLRLILRVIAPADTTEAQARLVQLAQRALE
jgi:glycine/serine hydroxymethyltransferase